MFFIINCYPAGVSNKHCLLYFHLLFCASTFDIVCPESQKYCKVTLRFKTISRMNGRTSRNQYTLPTFSKLGAKSWEHNQKISIAMQNGYHGDFAAII